MNVIDDVLVIEEKGIYSVEKFLMARRLMYWQVYLHKTSLVAEEILTRILKRAKELFQKGVALDCSKPLYFFIENKIALEDFDDSTLDKFAQLDDTDVLGAIKNWQFHKDYTLSELSRMIINRDLLKIKMSDEKFSIEEVSKLVEEHANKHKIGLNESKYFVFKGKIKNQAYSKIAEPIRILQKDGELEDVAILSDQLSLKALSKHVTKYFLCFPKQLNKS